MSAQIYKHPSSKKSAPDADRHAIHTCAIYVRGRIRDINAAETWFGIGEALAQLKGSLKKTSRGDNIHIGWDKAFELGEFPFSRQTADHLVVIHEYLTDSALSVKNLPAAWTALYAIATKLKPAAVRKLIENGSLSPATTRKQVLAMTKPAKPKQSKRTADPKDRLAAARDAYVAALKAALADNRQRADELHDVVHLLGLDYGDFGMQLVELGRKKNG